MEIQITTSADSASQFRGSAPVARVIATAGILEARLQRLLNAYLIPGALPQAQQ
jgi:hypothetical protein